MSSGIYKIHNILNNKVYVGQSLNIERRWESHINKLNKNNHHNAHLQSAWNKYSKNNFVFTIIEICTNDINNREIFWINYYDSFYNGYNLTRGGEGKPEYKVSEETKRKISHSLRGENAYSVIINDSKAKEIKLLIIDGYELNDIVRITGGG